MNRSPSFACAIVLMFTLAACSIAAPADEPSLTARADYPAAATQRTPPEPRGFGEALPEAEVREIRLPAPYDDARMEYSGLAWFGDTLVLLPQYPKRLGADGSAFLVAIKKDAILACLGAENDEPIEISLMAFDDGGLSDTLVGFEGFEALAFSGNEVFVTIETSGGSPMMGYLAAGRVTEDGGAVSLDPGKIMPLEPQTDFRNASDESLLIADGRIYTFFEDNGSALNPHPFAHVFDMKLNPLPDCDFPNIEFRVTDATELQPDGSFCVMNYSYPQDSHLKTGVDPIAERYGEGRTHTRSDRVERILRLRIENGRIFLAEEAPLYLSLTAEGSSRNWEGLVRLDDLGFLAVTDSFPRSILCFISDLE